MQWTLKKSGRDVVFSISNSVPFYHTSDWARLTNLWHTGPDIRDSWNCLYLLSFENDRWAPDAGTGHWNDPDLMILGNVSMGPEIQTRLTPDEQYSHVSLLSLIAAPLLIGCRIEQLDEFTLYLLSNDEVLEVNQDPLGKQARLMADEEGIQIYMKPTEDGSFAIGLFDTADFGKTPESYFRWGDEVTKQYSLAFEKLGLKGKWLLRDIWRQKDLGEFEGSFMAEIRHHGVFLLRMFRRN